MNRTKGDLSSGASAAATSTRRRRPTYDAAMPQFDAPHQQPDHPAPSEEKTARRVPIAMLITLVVSAAALGLLLWLILAVMNR